jgi:DHA1 family multidrug resistance protein-like MFS transporter
LRPRRRLPERSITNQWIVALVVGVSFLGFDITGPFMPLLVRELGVTDPQQAAFWGGILNATTPAIGVVTAPVWGLVADRLGPKYMAARSLAGFVFTYAAVAWATDLWQVWALRVATGVIAGYLPTMVALMVASAPRERTGPAVGMLQAAQFLALAAGPAIGGVMADHWGLRFNFYAAGALCLISLVLLLWGYRDVPGSSAAPNQKRPRPSFADVLTLPNLAVAMVILGMLQFVDRSVILMVPVFVAVLEPTTTAVGSLSGLVIAVAALATAASSWIYGRISLNVPASRLLPVALLLGALACAPIAFASDVWQLLGLRGALGLLSGGAIAMLYTAASRGFPPERTSSGMALLGTASMTAGALGPALAGVLATMSIHAVFLIDSALFGVALVMMLIGWKHRRDD